MAKNPPVLPTLDLWALDRLIPYARNPRTHTDEQIAQLSASIAEFGLVGSIAVRDGIIAKGHGTLSAVRRLYAAGLRVYPPPGPRGNPTPEPYPPGTIPVLDCSGWSDAQFRAYVIADNQLALNAGWDEELLRIEVGDLKAEDFDLDLLGFDDDFLDALLSGPVEPGAADPERAPTVTLADRFLVAPFSVLNGREGWWQERKRAWINLGIRSECGRGADLIPNGGGMTSLEKYQRGDSNG